MLPVSMSLQRRLILTLGNDVSFRSWHRHSGWFPSDSLVTI